MPCCGQPANGYAFVWQLRISGKDPQEFSNQAEAERARAAQGGIVLKVTKKIG